MIKKIDTAIVTLWGEQVGAVSWLSDQGCSIFEYDSAFLKKGLDISPIYMSLDEARKGDSKFSFPSLDKETFLGLPGLLADALPDKYGNQIINAWLARNGRDVASFSPVERLCYTGKRAMGALEFFPPAVKSYDKSVPVEIAELVLLAQEVINKRSSLEVSLGMTEKDNAEALADMIRVGTSAGGARSKAVIAMDDKGHVLSGQGDAPTGYDYWILKFDGVTDVELGEPRGYGRIEYAYYLMAQDAGIQMTECRLLKENGRAHFMTKRFDRIDGNKLHLQSLCGIAHYDYNHSGEYSYEQAFAIMQELKLSKAEIAQQYRRLLFNIIAKNLDDHTKNISFLMEPAGQWALSPAYDVTYAHNPKGQWTNKHQMTLNGKRDHFAKKDLFSVAETLGIKESKIILDEIIETVSQWPQFARQAGIKKEIITDIGRYHLTDIE